MPRRKPPPPRAAFIDEMLREEHEQRRQCAALDRVREPCMFCRSKPEMILRINDHREYQAAVACPGCRAVGPTTEHRDPLLCLLLALARWNSAPRKEQG